MKVSIETPLQKKPTKRAIDKIMGTLAKSQMVLSEVQSNYKMPITTSYFKGERPIPMISWSEAEGFGVHEVGLTVAGITLSKSELLARLNARR